MSTLKDLRRSTENKYIVSGNRCYGENEAREGARER
jgi:hypothetical protein